MSLEPIYQSIDVDFSQENFECVIGMEGDTGKARLITVSLLNDGQPYSISDIPNTNAYIVGAKSDGTYADDVCTIIDENTIQFALTDQMQAIAGDGEYSIKLADKTANRIIKSFPFTVHIKETKENATLIISTNDFKVLGDMIVQVENLKMNVEKNIEQVDDKINEVNILKDGLTALIQETTDLDATVTTNENSRIEAEKAREEKVTTALNNTNQAVKEIQTTNTSIQNAELARVFAETNRQTTFQETITDTKAAAEEARTAASNAQELKFDGMSSFPATGDSTKLYIDTSVNPRMLYTWDTQNKEYVLSGGAGGDDGTGLYAGETPEGETFSSIPIDADSLEGHSSSYFLHIGSDVTNAISSVNTKERYATPTSGNLGDLFGILVKGIENLTAKIDIISGTLNLPGAGVHNAIYRGKFLGDIVTDVQWEAISAGTFNDMYIGDYWTISGTTYFIAAFDYYYNTGDTACTTHHVTLVPNGILYNAAMNSTDTTTGAYTGSEMYTTGLTAAKETINTAFGSSHIMNHRQFLTNEVTGGYASAGGWYDSTVELMTEQNVYGCKIFGNNINGTVLTYNYTVDKSQYPLFAHRPDLIVNRQWFWLRDVASSLAFAGVSEGGAATEGGASYVVGVRPAFSIC